MSSFWSTSAAAATKDPKRNFRFKVTFTGLSTESVWFAKKVGKPNFTITESTHEFFNHKFYYPGRVEWQPVTLTLVDPVDDTVNTAAQMAALAEAAGYVIPKGPGEHLVSMTKGKAVSSIGTVEIVQLDGDGKALETWKLHNPFIKSFKWGDLDYTSDDITEMELELRYDWAELETKAQSADLNDVGQKKEFFKTTE
tara:strand:+ start:1085 stop:1675 length:591 start_codon:yes stop_codon:yes gene_type:complete